MDPSKILKMVNLASVGQWNCHFHTLLVDVLDFLLTSKTITPMTIILSSLWVSVSHRFGQDTAGKETWTRLKSGILWTFPFVHLVVNTVSYDLIWAVALPLQVLGWAHCCREGIFFWTLQFWYNKHIFQWANLKCTHKHMRF